MKKQKLPIAAEDVPLLTKCAYVANWLNRMGVGDPESMLLLEQGQVSVLGAKTPAEGLFVLQKLFERYQAYEWVEHHCTPIGVHERNRLYTEVEAKLPPMPEQTDAIAIRQFARYMDLLIRRATSKITEEELPVLDDKAETKVHEYYNSLFARSQLQRQLLWQNYRAVEFLEGKLRALYRFPLKIPDEIAFHVGIPHFGPIDIFATPGGGNSPLPAGLTVGTHPTAGFMHRFILSPAEQRSEELKVRQNGKLGQVTYRAEIGLPENLKPAHTTEETLRRIYDNILKRKEEGALLLKVHLDMTDQAYRAGGPLPIFRYDLTEAAVRMGYKIQSRREIHTGTARELYARIATLAGFWIEAMESRTGKKKYIDHSPYWVIQSVREAQAGDEMGEYRILLDDPNAPILHSVLIQPGLWWAAAQMSHYHLHIPREIIALPTDGKGNEENRIALKLAACLAMWERTEANKGVGDVERTLGVLLERAGIITYDDLIAMGQHAKRIREYLVGKDSLSGAFKTLRTLGAFDVDVLDEEEFAASGRGWIDRFWNARIRLGVRALKDVTPSGRDGVPMTRVEAKADRKRTASRKRKDDRS